MKNRTCELRNKDLMGGRQSKDLVDGRPSIKSLHCVGNPNKTCCFININFKPDNNARRSSHPTLSHLILSKK